MKRFLFELKELDVGINVCTQNLATRLLVSEQAHGQDEIFVARLMNAILHRFLRGVRFFLGHTGCFTSTDTSNNVITCKLLAFII